jgi:hypothetical protein
MKRYRQPDAHGRLVATAFLLSALVSRMPILNAETEKAAQVKAQRMANDMLARIYPKRPTAKRPKRTPTTRPR